MDVSELLVRIGQTTDKLDVKLVLMLETRDRVLGAVTSFRQVEVSRCINRERLFDGQPGLVLFAEDSDALSGPTLDDRGRPLVTPVESRIFEVSTAHVTQQDMNLVEMGIQVVALNRDEGAFVHVPWGDSDFASRITAMQQAGYSAAFIALIRRAARRGCSWILFDCDVASVDGLPKFEW
jgi:hypothetical protein